MYTRFVMRSWEVALVLIGVAILNPVAVASDAPENYLVIDGVAIYQGVIPAQIVQGHPTKHTEARMHGGVPTRGRQVHMVVALFGNTTGQRIENAQVTGSIMEIVPGVEQKKLEPMRIAGSITYGNYFTMPDKKTYHIKLQIRRSDIQGVIEAEFRQQHFGD